MSVEQNADTRVLLGRLDVAILDLEDQQRKALEIERLAQEHATAVGEIKGRLMRIRDELRPLTPQP